MIEKGSKVSIHYTLKVEDETIDTSEGEEPFNFVQGEGELIPGLEEALVGLKSGDKKSVTLTPEQAYGDYDDEAVQTVERSSFEDADKLEVGDVVTTEVEDEEFEAAIVEINADEITLDFNHPLAGQTLNFDVEIVSVE